MDATKVRTAERELVERMVALGYSEYYVRELERLCRWLADEADGFEEMDEVERAVRAKWASDSASRRMLRHLWRIVMNFPVSLTGRRQAASGWLAWASSNSQGLM